VEPKTADELVRIERHRAIPARSLDPVVFDTLQVTLRSSAAISRRLEMAARCVERDREASTAFGPANGRLA
jgi:hypothetical protein